MIVSAVLVLICIVLVIAVLWNLVRSKDIEQQTRRLPPGPSGLPIVGQAFNLSINSAHLHFTKWGKEHGDIFMFSIFGKRVVVLNTPDVIRKTFCEKELCEYTSDRPESFIGQFIANSYKDILFRRYDDVCQKLKTATLKAMISFRNGDVYETLQRAEINEYVRRITNHNGNDVNIIEPIETSLCKLIGILVCIIHMI